MRSEEEIRAKMDQLRKNNSAVEKRYLADPDRYGHNNPCESVIAAIVAMEYCLGESKTLGPYPPDGAATV